MDLVGDPAGQQTELAKRPTERRRGVGPGCLFPVTSQLDGEVREVQVRFANTRYRIVYQRSENLVVLLHAIEKDTGAVPRPDIEGA